MTRFCRPAAVRHPLPLGEGIYEEKAMINLGDKVRDPITGFEGIVTSRSEHINGCTRIGVQPPMDKDGRVPSPEWLDEPAVDLIEAGVFKPKSRKTGGPLSHTPRLAADEPRRRG